MSWLMMKRILMQKAGEGSGGGSGGEGGGGEDADAKLIATINKVVHAAMADRDKRLETKLSNMMNTAIGGKFDEIRQLLVESDDKDETPPGDERPNPGQGQQRHATMSPEDRAAMKKAQADAAEAKKKADEWENRAKQEAEKSRRAEERQLLVSSLQGKVKPALLDMAVDQLHAKYLQRDEETGNILWKDADGTLVPAKDGVAAWVKSDVGKEFLPARDARGSGGRGGEEIPTRPGSMSMEGLGDIVNQAMSRNR